MRKGAKPRRSRAARPRRGFALLLVMVVVAMMASVALSQIDRVGFDFTLLGEDRRTQLARAVADGAVMEVINDERTVQHLPDFTTPRLTATYSPPTNSPYFNSAMHHSYRADVRLLRFVSVAESSQTWSRALVYEVASSGAVDDERTTAETEAQIFRTIIVPAGTLLPRVHAR